MRLISIEYSEFLNEPQEWRIDKLSLGTKNLIVGRNSTGKTRTLNIISASAQVISGLQGIGLSGKTSFTWQCNKGKYYSYSFEIQNNNVASEELIVDGKTLLTRNANGIGHIYAEKIKAPLEFQMPPKELAIVKRRDLIQHGYIEPIYNWAMSVRHYHFGSHFGKEIVAIINPAINMVNDRDENAVIGIFRAGVKEFGELFTNAIKSDMSKVGYNIEEISSGTPVTINFTNPPGEITSIILRQKEFTGIVDQWSMSQGMYRLLSICIHINYMQLKGTGSCLLIDDIGEGLDFERSCQAITLLREKAEKSNIQLIMSSNDRFVMNEVPLTEWTVLSRKGSHVSVRNYENSKEQFDEFRFTGLSNASFFELDYLEPDEAESE